MRRLFIGGLAAIPTAVSLAAKVVGGMDSLNVNAEKRADKRAKNRLILIVGGLLALIVVVLSSCIGGSGKASASDYPVMSEGVQGPFTVTKVVDGDTIWVDANGKRLKIRMIGLDTPETVDPRKPVHCFGLEASAQAKTILGGQSVYLETDPSQDSVDRYGRTLAYVWTASGRLLNLDMIADGFAFEYTYDLPYRYQQDFRAAENDARTQERGLWSPGACAA